jgi:uncharacterized protein (DUF1501 family)
MSASRTKRALPSMREPCFLSPLAPANLFNGQDLAVTTDFRDVFAEALNRHMLVNVSRLAPV